MKPNASWFGVRLHFLNESDQDAVGLVMQRGLIGLTVEVTRKDGSTIPYAALSDAEVYPEGQEIGPDNLGSMRFSVLDDHGNPTAAPDVLIRYEDLAAIGVY